MNQDIYTKVYQRAVQDNDKELQDFLEEIAREIDRKDKRIQAFDSLQRAADKDYEELFDRAEKIISMAKRHPDKVHDLYRAWDNDYIPDESEW